MQDSLSPAALGSRASKQDLVESLTYHLENSLPEYKRFKHLVKNLEIDGPICIEECVPFTEEDYDKLKNYLPPRITKCQ